MRTAAWPWPPWKTALSTRLPAPLAAHPEAAEQVDSYPGLGLQGRAGDACPIGQADFVCALSAQPVPSITGEHGQWLLRVTNKGRWPGSCSMTACAMTRHN